MTFDGRTYDDSLDGPRMSTQLLRVRTLLLEERGSWFTLAEICDRCGGSEAGVSARLRDLRKEKFGGFHVERRRRGDPKRGLWEYRIGTARSVTQTTFEGLQDA